MKIGILTQPIFANYGGILQNFALQKILRDFDHNVVTLNRKFNKPNQIRAVISNTKNCLIQKLSGRKERIFTQNEIDYIASNTKKFIDQNIFLSELLDSDSKVKTHYENNNYDAIIVGSDQVWRPSYSPNIYNYFLDFALRNSQIKKIAYAASFGVDDWEFDDNQTKKCSELVKLFNAVSVREESGIKLCADFFNVNAIMVLDPTMLLDKNDYLSIFDFKSLPKRKGIFTYILDKTEFKSQAVNKVGDLLNLEMFDNQPKENFAYPISKNIDDFVYPSVETWLKAFYDADFVITDSFHGTVFSILFQKSFIVLENETRGQARFNSLLNMFDLQNRMISDIDKISEVISEPVNYSNVNSILIERRKVSLAFLINSLK
ncbi:MAG: polysaccharide pyruvyl transferase family protein [Brumimicrobium sp.]|nr:polysaccharide pyruvyl transferase family protein [Brumimicrobium sp.]